MVIDVHTHAFPDDLAERAIPLLEEEGDVTAHLDGKISSLVASMDSAGIDASVVASIATKPEQFESILKWSQSIVNDRVIPFASVHPADPLALERISRIGAAGLRGLKMHPYYQDFYLDAPELLPLYREIEREGLVLLMHTGFDIAFERKRVSDPDRLVSVLGHFPGLKIIASHFGAWEDWDEVEEHILGKPVYIDTSYSVPFLGERRARDFLLRHPEEYLLFGSDSPWGNQKDDLELLRKLDIGPSRSERMLGANAAKLLGLE